MGSRFISGMVSRYAPIEGEALALVDGLEKARHFVLGCPDLLVAVDHKSLTKLFGDRSLADIPNPCLLNLKERSLRFLFSISYIPGARNKAADAVSAMAGMMATSEQADTGDCTFKSFMSQGSI